jgi:hypothetical protein
MSSLHERQVKSSEPVPMPGGWLPILASMIQLDIPGQYTLPVARSDWSELLAEWQPILPQGSSPWLLTKLGELFFCHDDGKMGLLQVGGFQYQMAAIDKRDFQEWLVDPDKMSQWFLTPLVDPLAAVGKPLAPEFCCSFIWPPALGGALTVENVMVISIRAHFRCWGDIFRQMKDVPDGGQVILKVARRGV